MKVNIRAELSLISCLYSTLISLNLRKLLHSRKTCAKIAHDSDSLTWLQTNLAPLDIPLSVRHNQCASRHELMSFESCNFLDTEYFPLKFGENMSLYPRSGFIPSKLTIAPPPYGYSSAMKSVFGKKKLSITSFRCRNLFIFWTAKILFLWFLTIKNLRERDTRKTNYHRKSAVSYQVWVTITQPQNEITLCAHTMTFYSLCPSIQLFSWKKTSTPSEYVGSL